MQFSGKSIAFFVLVVLALGAICVSSAASSSPPLRKHRCVHDKVKMKDIPTVPQDYGKVLLDKAAARGAAAKARDTSAFKNLRIKWFFNIDGKGACTKVGQKVSDYSGFYAYCKADDIASATKVAYWSKLLNEAANFFSNAMQSTPVKGALVPPKSCDGVITNGSVANADFVIYATAVPSPSVNGDTSTTLAWATSCATDAAGRSIAAQINFAPSMIFPSSRVQYELDRHTTIHELSHALGFSDPWFPDGTYIDLNGNSVSGGVISYKSAALGKKVTKINSPRVLAKARAYFNCSTLDGVEIEDQGGDGTAGSHWEERILAQEMMSGVVITPSNYVTSITLAFFEDLGFYKINYSVAEDAGMQWGRNTNCDITGNKCNAKLPGTAKTFCTNNPGASDVCTIGRIGIGSCGLYSYPSIPSNFQYYPSNPKRGGYDVVDYCPVIEADAVTVCIDETNENDTVLGMNFGAGSRCFQSTLKKTTGTSYGPNTGSSRCHFFSCAANGRLTIKVNSVSVLCPADGSTANVTVPGFTGFVTCPPATEMCGKSPSSTPTPKPLTAKPSTAKPATPKPSTAAPKTPTSKPKTV